MGDLGGGRPCLQHLRQNPAFVQGQIRKRSSHHSLLKMKRDQHVMQPSLECAPLTLLVVTRLNRRPLCKAELSPWRWRSRTGQGGVAPYRRPDRSCGRDYSAACGVI